MANTHFRVKQIDHVELYVPDQYEGARWYQNVLGFEIVAGFEHWAKNGPLMISSDSGSTMLALFKGQGPGFQEPLGFRRVAFRVDAGGFLRFFERLNEHPVYDFDGRPAHTLEIVDHDQAYSLYFCDPYGNRYEVTTYDYQAVQDRLS